MISSTNSRVAKNAFALTIRMVMVICVGLYTSRIVLQALGLEDYGTYGVVGGIISLAVFLNFTMSSATSRFITFELGKRSDARLQMIFSTALSIHCILALIVVIFSETIGLWFLNNKMSFPEGSMTDVNILYQFSVLCMVISYTQVPYTAEIIAHEKMNIYAYVEIFNSLAKLGLAYLLFLCDNNRLIIYGAAMAILSIATAMFYRFYCVKRYPESGFSLHIDKTVARQMLVFSGLDLYGNMCVAARDQGQPIILNLFFGVLANAGCSIAKTVTSQITALTTTIFQAFSPQIIKQYAGEHLHEMQVMMERSINFTLTAYTCIAIPCQFETARILYLWLGQVPPYSVDFVNIIIFTTYFNIIIRAASTALQATGNIKAISVITGTMHLISLIAGYFSVRYGGPAWSMYSIGLFFTIGICVISCVYVKKQIKEFKLSSFIKAIIRNLSVSIATAIIIFIVTGNIGFMTIGIKKLSWLANSGCFMLSLSLTATVLLPLSYFFVLSSDDRAKMKRFFGEKLSFKTLSHE